MIQIIAWVGIHLLTLGLIILVAAGTGRLLLRKISFSSISERLAFTIALGLGAWALLIFALGLAHLLYKGTFWGLTLAGAAGALWQLAPAIKGRLRQWRAAPRPEAGTLLLWLLVGLVAITYWAMLLWSTQYPPVHWDAISHHLLLPRAFLQEHHLVAVMGSPHPVMPALNHMLFTWAVALHDDVSAQMVEHLFLMLTALLFYAWGQRRQRRALGLAAAACWLGNPLVLWLGESAYVDIALVCFVFLGIYGLRVFFDRQEIGWWYLAMGLFGMAAGVKLPGLFFLIGGSFLGLWLLVRSRLKWQTLVKGWGLAFFMMLPFYAFITYFTHNPIWPTFPQYSQGIWGAPAVVTNTNSWLQNAAEPRTVQNFMLLSLDWLRYPGRFFAETNLSLFPLLAIWPLAWIVAIWDRQVRWWALWALAFTLYWFEFPHLLRYWLPALPLATLALFESLQWMMERVWKRQALHHAVWAIVALSSLLWGARSLEQEFYNKGELPTQPAERQAFLTKTFASFRGLRYLNKQASENERVAVINCSYLNYYFKPHPVDLFGLLNSGRLPYFHWPEDQEWVNWLEAENVDWIFVDYANAPPFLHIPKQNLVTDPVWPDFEIVYADSTTWIFRHKPVPPEKF